MRWGDAWKTADACLVRGGAFRQRLTKEEERGKEERLWDVLFVTLHTFIFYYHLCVCVWYIGVGYEMYEGQRTVLWC